MLVMKESSAGEHGQLVDRIRSGDGKAEEELVRYFSPRVFAMLMARTRDREAARDLLQDVLIAVLRAVRDGALRDTERLVPFVHGTARNLVNNYFRDKIREPKTEELTDDCAGVMRQDLLEADERERMVRRALEMMDEVDRRIVLMTMVEGFKPGDIASQLGLSSEVVRQRKSRAIKKIAEFVRGLSRSPLGDYH
jgi:RNA polymerase sigma-70 factor (ECF subfamily)